MKYFAVAIPDDDVAEAFIEIAEHMFPEAKIKEVVLDDIDGDTFETVTVLT